MKLRVLRLIGPPQDVTMKDGTVIKKQQFAADDNKMYSTFARVEEGQEYEGDVTVDTRSGELRFKKAKVPFTPRGGGGESNRQTALKAASAMTGPDTVTDVLEAAESFLKWLEAGSQGAAPSPLATQGAQNPVSPALEQVFPGSESADLPPLDSYEGLV